MKLNTRVITIGRGLFALARTRANCATESFACALSQTLFAPAAIKPRESTEDEAALCEVGCGMHRSAPVAFARREQKEGSR